MVYKIKHLKSKGKVFLIEYVDRGGNVYMKDIKAKNWQEAQKHFQKIINKKREFLLNSVSEY